MARYFLSRKLNLTVNWNEDGTLSLTYPSGERYENSGLLIAGAGGVERFWELCIDENERQRRLEARAYEKQEKERRKSERAAIAAAQHKAAFDALPSPIPVTYENLGIVLRYLNDQNFGAVTLPSLAMGYTYNQYDSDGRIASAIVLDSDLIENGENLGRRFCVGAPAGHLSKYMRCR